MERTPTHIEVEVIDLQHVKDHVFDTYLEQRSNNEASESYDRQFDDVVGFTFRYSTFARYVTSNNEYHLVNENGEIEQTTRDAPSYWDVYKEIRKGAGYEAGMPESKVGIFPSDIDNAQVIEVKNLADFVRSFGSSVEKRYDYCRKLLEQLEKVA